MTAGAMFLGRNCLTRIRGGIFPLVNPHKKGYNTDLSRGQQASMQAAARRSVTGFLKYGES